MKPQVHCHRCRPREESNLDAGRPRDRKTARESRGLNVALGEEVGRLWAKMAPREDQEGRQGELGTGRGQESGHAGGFTGGAVPPG